MANFSSRMHPVADKKVTSRLKNFKEVEIADQPRAGKQGKDSSTKLFSIQPHPNVETYVGWVYILNSLWYHHYPYISSHL